jgi:hypothetical protein
LADLDLDWRIWIRIGGSRSGTGRRQFRIRFVLYWVLLRRIQLT